MRCEPSYFGIYQLLVNTLWSLFFSNYFIIVVNVAQCLLFFFCHFDIWVRLCLNYFAIVLKALFHKAFVVFGCENFKKDVFVFQEIHRNIFQIAAKSLQERNGEKNVSHSDSFGRNLAKVKEIHPPFHFFHKIIQKKLFSFLLKSNLFYRTIFVNHRKLFVNILKVHGNIRHISITHRSQSFEKVFR